MCSSQSLAVRFRYMRAHSNWIDKRTHGLVQVSLSPPFSLFHSFYVLLYAHVTETQHKQLLAQRAQQQAQQTQRTAQQAQRAQHIADATDKRSDKLAAEYDDVMTELTGYMTFMGLIDLVD